MQLRTENAAPSPADAGAAGDALPNLEDRTCCPALFEASKPPGGGKGAGYSAEK